MRSGDPGHSSNKIYSIGGLGSNNTLTGAFEEYDPVADSWTTKSSMSVPRSLSSAAVFNGKIYVFGGSEANGIISATVEEYNPETDTWSVKASMPTARYGLAASTANSKIYAIGGYYDFNLSSGPTDIVEEYDPLTDIWNTVASMPTKRYYLSSITVNEEIFAIGGQSGGTLNVVEKYSPSTNSWLTKTPMPHGGGGSFASALSNKIFVVGIGDFTKVYEYDPLLDP